jgi:hypothetical protein
MFGLKLLRIVEPEVVRQVCLYRPAKSLISSTVDALGAFVVPWMRNWNSEARNLLPLGD